MKLLIISNKKQRTRHYYTGLTVSIYHHAVDCGITVQDDGRYKIVNLATLESQGVLQCKVLEYTDEGLQKFKEKMHNIGLEVYMEMV